MQVVVYSMLNPRPAEKDLYNALPEADPTLFPDEDQPEMEEEAELAREAENLAAGNVAPSVAQDEVTRQAEPSCSNQVPLPDFHDFRARLESLQQGQVTLQQELKRLDEVDEMLFGRSTDSLRLHPKVRDVYVGAFKELEDVERVSIFSNSCYGLC